MIRKIAGTGAAVLTAAAAVAAMNAAPAHAANYTGTVTASPNLAVRYAPSKHSIRVDTLPNGDVVSLGCWVTGSRVNGTRVWFSLPTDTPSTQWVSGAFVQVNGSTPPRCIGAQTTGRTTARLAMRTGPNTADTRIRTLARGQRLTIVCKQPAQHIGGNNRWYWVKNNGKARGWVSARFVHNTGSAPQFCRFPLLAK
jgi:uncharacterized protein YraI